MSLIKGFVCGLFKTAAKLLVIMSAGIVAERVVSKIPGLPRLTPEDAQETEEANHSSEDNNQFEKLWSTDQQ